MKINLPFGDVPNRKNLKVTRLLFINTNGLDLEQMSTHSTNSVVTANSKSTPFYCSQKPTNTGKINMQRISSAI